MSAFFVASFSARKVRGLVARMSARVLGVVALVAAVPAWAGAIGIQGTMSNFDVFNDTGIDVYGAELDLDGLSSAQVTKTYPCHFQSLSKTDYPSGVGTKLIFTGYSFPPNPAFLTPAPSVFSTNGHYAVNVQGVEHFGFSTPAQATKSSFYWLDKNLNRINATPLSVPQTTWSFVAAAGVNPAAVQIAIAPPAPPPLVPHGDAVWVKVFTTELPAQADLNELISYDPNNLDPKQPSVAPQLPSEVETEWELLADDSVGALQPPDVQVGNNQQAVVRRFEYYKYTGAYDEVHLPLSNFTTGQPDPAELGKFMMANMVAANLLADIPEPSSLFLLGVGGAMVGFRRTRARFGSGRIKG